MDLEQRHIDALDKAETLMFHSDFCPYLELKEMLTVSTPQARSQFRSLFTDYYGLNVGGLTAPFKDRYFEILFGGDVFTNGQPRFAEMLTELCAIPSATGRHAMPFSFVSKLVAIHLESSPIYDRYVRALFSGEAPGTAIDQQKRIAWYVGFLKQVSESYEAWAKDERVIPIINRLKARDQKLALCHVNRLLDFLVWKVGNQELL
jgi:hypothetical protein